MKLFKSGRENNKKSGRGQLTKTPKTQCSRLDKQHLWPSQCPTIHVLYTMLPSLDIQGHQVDLEPCPLHDIPLPPLTVPRREVGKLEFISNHMITSADFVLAGSAWQGITEMQKDVPFCRTTAFSSPREEASDHLARSYSNFLALVLFHCPPPW